MFRKNTNNSEVNTNDASEPTFISQFLVYTLILVRAGPRVSPARLWAWATPHPWGNHREKKKNFFLSFSPSCSLLQMAGSTEEENDERNRRKTSKRKRIE
jgi:hypothetical protein